MQDNAILQGWYILYPIPTSLHYNIITYINLHAGLDYNIIIYTNLHGG